MRANAGLLESVRVLADRLRILLEGGQRLLAAHGPDAVRQVAVEVALNLDAVHGAALVGPGGSVSAAAGTLSGARVLTTSPQGSTLVWNHGDEMRQVDAASMLWDTIEISGDTALESVEAFVAEVSDIDDEGSHLAGDAGPAHHRGDGQRVPGAPRAGARGAARAAPARRGAP